MKITYNEVQSVSVEVGAIRITIPSDEVENGECYTGVGRIPPSLCKSGDAVLTIDTNGKIKNWPDGHEIDAYFKPVDSGTYQLLDTNSRPIGGPLENHYVPKCLDMNDGGDDYLALKVNRDGIVDGFVKAFTANKIANMLSNVEEND